MGTGDQDRKLIANWLRRHKGARRFDSGTRGEVRMLAERRRRRANVCLLGGDWYAIETASRGERETGKELREAGFETYLPEFRAERQQRRTKRKVITDQVLFPRYMFVRAYADQIAELRDVSGVADILPGFPLVPVPVKAEVIKKLRAAQSAHLLDDTDQGRKARGQDKRSNLDWHRKRLLTASVLVKDGPFASFPGIVESVHSLERLTVLVSIFGRPTPIELDTGQIEVVSKRRLAA